MDGALTRGGLHTESESQGSLSESDSERADPTGVCMRAEGLHVPVLKQGRIGGGTSRCETCPSSSCSQ
eukprot:226347-Chlamydomonas_euryale.AAC.3